MPEALIAVPLYAPALPGPFARTRPARRCAAPARLAACAQRVAIPLPWRRVGRWTRGASFNSLGGWGEHRGRNFKPERLRGLEVDDQLVLGRRLHRQVARLLAFEDTIDVAGSAPILIEKIRPIGNQTAIS